MEGEGVSGGRPHLDQDGKKEAGAELMHALGCHAAIIAVVGLLLQDTGLHIWQLPVAWREGGWGPAIGCGAQCAQPWLSNGVWYPGTRQGGAWEAHAERPPAAQLQTENNGVAFVWVSNEP